MTSKESQVLFLGNMPSFEKMIKPKLFCVSDIFIGVQIVLKVQIILNVLVQIVVKEKNVLRVWIVLKLQFVLKVPIVKFIFSEKAKNFCEISTLLLSYVVPAKSKVEILQNFVAFSE